MARVIRCECGFVAHGADDDEVVNVIREHMRTDHRDLYDSVDRADLFSWIQME